MTRWSVSDVFGRLKCRIGLHTGYPENIGGWMMFYCTRCEKHVSPISPEKTAAITRELYEQEGYEHNDCSK